MLTKKFPLQNLFLELTKNLDYASLRFEDRHDEKIGFRKGVMDPLFLNDDQGFMMTVYHRGGMGYVASSNVSEEGIKNALTAAKDMAENFQKKFFNTNLSELKIGYEKYTDNNHTASLA